MASVRLVGFQEGIGASEDEMAVSLSEGSRCPHRKEGTSKESRGCLRSGRKAHCDETRP